MKKKQILQNPSLTLPLTGQGKNGFTLFELLVSISIIGILTALASVAYSGAQKKARDTRRIEDIRSIQIAAEQYYSQASYVYPAAGKYTAGVPWTPPAAGSTTILESYPSDPKGAAYGSYNCAAGTCSATGYCVCALMENSANANSIGAACSFGAGAKTHFCAKNQQ